MGKIWPEAGPMPFPSRPSLARLGPGSCQNLARSWPDSGQEAHRKLAGIPSASLRNRTGSSQGSHRPGRTAATKGKSTESSTSNRAEIPVRIAKASHSNLTRCTRTPHQNLTSTAHEAYIKLQRICEASAWEPHGISKESVTERQAICKQTGRKPVRMLYACCKETVQDPGGISTDPARMPYGSHQESVGDP